MTDFAVANRPAPPILTPWSMESIGAALSGSGASVLGAITSNTWPTANLAVYYPFRLHSFATVRQLLFWVGATSNGNIDVGIYDKELRRIVSAGTTAMSATVNTVQELNVTDTLLPPGEYLLAAACSSTSGTVFRRGITTDEDVLTTVPVYEEASALPLPATATPVISTSASSLILAGIGIQFAPTF